MNFLGLIAGMSIMPVVSWYLANRYPPKEARLSCGFCLGCGVRGIAGCPNCGGTFQPLSFAYVEPKRQCGLCLGCGVNRPAGCPNCGNIGDALPKKTRRRPA